MNTSRRQVAGFSLLSAALSAGYGVLFTLIGDFRDTYGISETALGWIIGAGFIAEFVAQLVIAPLGDRGRARQILWLGSALYIIGLVVVAFSGTAWLIGGCRVLSGLAGGAMIPVVRRIVVLGDADNVGRNLGQLMSASIFGFAVGPAISAVLAEPFGLAAPFLVVAGVGAVTAVAVLVTTEIPEATAGGEPQPRLAFDLLADTPLVGALCFGAAAFVMIGAFDILWDLVHEDLDTPTWLANIGISIFALPLIVLAPISGRLAERVGPFRLGGAGLVVAAGFMASYGLLGTGTAIVMVSLAHAVTDGFTIASTGVAVAMTAPHERQAGAQGLLGAAQALAAGLTAPVIGAIYQSQGRLAAYTTSSAMMLGFVVIGTILAWPFIRSRRAGGTPGLAGSS